MMPTRAGRGTRGDGEDGLRQLVRQSRLPALLFRPRQGDILEVSDSLVALFRASRDELVGRLVLDFVVDEAGPRARLALMEAGELHGYHVIDRGYRRPDGSEFTVDTSVKSYGQTAYAVGVLVPEQRVAPSTEVAEPTATDAVVLGTVDQEWRIDRISDTVEQMLGYLPREVVGKPIAALVDPVDLPTLLVAAGHGLQSAGGATRRIRLRAANGRQRECRMLVTRMVGPSADALGFAFAITGHGPASGVHRNWELERALQHIAREIEATGVLAGIWGAPTTTRLSALAGLSSRELEIVTRLLAGDRVPMIAQQLFLSESTVRNHLTSVFRKLGVRSQQELLTLLRAAQVAGHSGGFV